MKKVAFLTLGCKVNTYDTQSMLNIFTHRGYEEVDFSDYSDVYVINTCTVTNLSDRKSRQMIRKAIKTNDKAIVVACGCYAQISPNEVLSIDGIDIVIGTNDRNKIVDIVESYNQEKISYVSDIMKADEYEELFIDQANGTRAFIKIQEGCNNFCSYCIIPYARGNIKSRRLENIIDEVTNLSLKGIKEIVLSGIHIASYGRDLENIDLINVIEEISKIPDIKRIRFSSVEPNFINRENLDRLSKIEEVCDFIHLSLQSGSNKVLTDMNRKYTKEEYKIAVNLLREYFPTIGITTDVIVGFPNESDDDFQDTLDFCEEVGFSKIHVFPFSAKKGTKAYDMGDTVPDDVKKKRSKALRECSDRLERNFIKKFDGKVLNVLFESKNREDVYEGYSKNYLKVISKEKDLENKILDVKVFLKENQELEVK